MRSRKKDVIPLVSADWLRAQFVLGILQIASHLPQGTQTRYPCLNKRLFEGDPLEQVALCEDVVRVLESLRVRSGLDLRDAIGQLAENGYRAILSGEAQHYINNEDSP